jgi:hypothetical protein
MFLSYLFFAFLFIFFFYKRETKQEHKKEFDFYSSYILSCTICLEAYSSLAKPICLPSCGHSFCAPCLTKIRKIHDSEIIVCPLCQQITFIPKTGLPPNYIFQEMFSDPLKNEQDKISTDSRRTPVKRKNIKSNPFRKFLSLFFKRS